MVERDVFDGLFMDVLWMFMVGVSIEFNSLQNSIPCLYLMIF